MVQFSGSTIIIITEDASKCFKSGFTGRADGLQKMIKEHWRTSWHSLFQQTFKTEATSTEKYDLLMSGDGRDRLISTCRAIAHLANIDGCVVFDRSLVLHGFGWMIQAQEESRTSNRPLLNHKGRELNPDDVLRQRGSRHLAAYQYCRANPGSIAFVISQDGDIRVFSSNQDYVGFLDKVSV